MEKMKYFIGQIFNMKWFEAGHVCLRHDSRQAHLSTFGTFFGTSRFIFNCWVNYTFNSPKIYEETQFLPNKQTLFEKKLS